MQNANSVITQAFDGLVSELCNEIGVTDKRLYELLGKDNPYPKLWRLLNPLGRLDFDRLLCVQADFNARVARLAPKPFEAASPSRLHKELTEAMQAVLDRLPAAERKRELLQAQAEINKQLALCED